MQGTNFEAAAHLDAAGEPGAFTACGHIDRVAIQREPAGSWAGQGGKSGHEAFHEGLDYGPDTDLGPDRYLAGFRCPWGSIGSTPPNTVCQADA